MYTVLSSLLSNNKTKNRFTPWKAVLIKKFKYELGACTASFDSYTFQLAILLKPDFNCSSSFALSWVDKFTTGTQNFVSVIANVAASVSLDDTICQTKLRRDEFHN